MITARVNIRAFALPLAFRYAIGIACALAASSVNHAAQAADTQLSIDVDMAGLAKSIQTDHKHKRPFDPEDKVDHLNGEPERLVVTFDKEKVDCDNDYGKRHLVIFPIQQYRALYPNVVRTEFDKKLATIKKIIKAKSDRASDEIPIFPDCDSHEMFHNQERYLKFKQGSGITFLSAYSNGDPPISNDALFYCFQGLTANGKYYVSLFYPVHAKGLPEKSPGAEQYLGSLARTKFRPSLEALDRMIESIDISSVSR